MSKTKRLFLLLPVFCNNEYLDARPKYALVGVDLELATGMIAQIERVRRFKKEEDSDIYQFESWDYSPAWIASLDGWDKEPHLDLLTGEGDALALVENGSPVLLAARPSFDEDDENNRTEGGMRLVSNDGVKWQAIPKHTSSYIDTACVFLNTWQSIQKVLQSPNQSRSAASIRKDGRT